jgi:hypothetical protein
MLLTHSVTCKSTELIVNETNYQNVLQLDGQYASSDDISNYVQHKMRKSS